MTVTFLQRLGAEPFKYDIPVSLVAFVEVEITEY